MRQLSLLLLTVFMGACASPVEEVSEEHVSSARYQARIRWTTYGVPHVLAEDLGSAAFGQGYACGKMNLWVLADQFIKVRSERALYFGPGPRNANIISDLGNQAMRLYEKAERGFPLLEPDLQAAFAGYAAGYNRALEERKPLGCPHDCRNLDWVKPIDGVDVFAYSLQTAVLLTGGRLQAPMVAAAPPKVGEVAELPNIGMPPTGVGSNGWALGQERTINGNGILLANPHFPWDGELRMYECQLTVPGKLNVSGASILGVPMITIGFNESLGWTHTVCTAHHGTIYSLRLVPGQPTSYYYDGEVRHMEPQQVEVHVLQEDGSLQTIRKTLWQSHYGPMIAAEGLEWTDERAYTFRDANGSHQYSNDFWLRAASASSTKELQKVLLESHGLPWVNTMAADRKGDVLYADASSVPNLSSMAQVALKNQIQQSPLMAQLYNKRITILDGSRSAFEWEEGDSHRPGLLPLSRAPQLLRKDFVGNSNDSHWLSNPKAPLEGFSLLYGSERTERSLRTRQGLRLFGEGLFSQESVMKNFDDTRSLSADLLLDDLLTRCEGKDSALMADGSEVDISKACQLLQDWDRRFDLNSVGAHIWREFITQFKDGERHLSASIYQIPFDPEAPIDTPARLAVPREKDPFLMALGRAVQNLDRAHVRLEATLGELQYSPQGGRRVPLPGGTTIEGVFNVNAYKWMGQGITLPATVTLKDVVNPISHLTPEGYPCNFGASYCLVAEFTDDGPRAKGRVAYSQSTDPTSPHFSDQGWLETQGEWRDILFTEDEILSDPNLWVQEIEG